MTNSVTYQVNLDVVGEKIIGKVTTDMDKLRQSTQKTTKSFGDCFKNFLAFETALNQFSNLRQSLDDLNAPGITLNSNMAELSAITGVTGKGLKDIESAARQTSKTFGTDASANVESYKLVLSQLDPEIAKNSEAMKMMGDNINVLSKQMKGDTVTATNVLTTSMNQFGISTENPIQAAKVMGEMMNTMSAAAQAGSAELPQIQSALEQVGMVAKTTGLSFEATNAQIQILDKAGKKGSEGGVALRNVLTTLSEGRFTSKLAAKGLQDAGISVEYLADKSIPLTDKLRTLRTIQGDTALMTKVFGKENMAAAIAMINGADTADELTQQITGTNSAVEQAEIIMGSYSEKMARNKARWDNLKISIFNVTESFQPLINKGLESIDALGKLSFNLSIINSTLQAVKNTTAYSTIATRVNTFFTNHNSMSKVKARLSNKRLSASMKLTNIQMGLGAVLAKIQATSIRSVAIAFGQATIGATAFQLALDALGIGLILLAITGLIAGLQHLYHHSRKFREILGYIGGAGKAVFHNIGVFIKRLWNLVIKPIALAYWGVYQWVFTNIWNFVKSVFGGIKNIVLGAWNGVIKPVALWIHSVYTKVFRSILNTVVRVFNGIKNFATGVWNWIKETFGTFGSWVEDTLITPIYSAFSNVWNWLNTLLDNIVNKLSDKFSWIIKIWNKLFSSKGMLDIHVKGLEGAKNEGAEFDREKAKGKTDQEPQKVELVQNQFDLQEKAKTPTLGGTAVKSVSKSNGVGSSVSTSDSGNKVRNLTIGKMMENFNVHMNTSNGIDKTELYNAVKEALLTASADFVGIN